MRAKEFVVEAITGKFKLPTAEILVDRHALIRAVERDVSPIEVDKVLRMLPRIEYKLSEISAGQKVWIYSEQSGISVGIRRLDDRMGINRFILGTVLRTKPWSDRLPVITIESI